MKWIVLTILGSSLASLCSSASANSVNQSTDAAVIACKSLSTLVNPSFATSRAHFSDSDEIVALLVQGIKPPPSMKEQPGAELCLYYPRLQLAAAHQVMEGYGLPYAFVGPVFRMLMRVPFYALYELRTKDD